MKRTPHVNKSFGAFEAGCKPTTKGRGPPQCCTSGLNCEVKKNHYSSSRFYKLSGKYAKEDITQIFEETPMSVSHQNFV